VAAKIDPELLEILDQPGKSGVQAVLQLKSAGKSKALLSPDEAKSIADALLDRVASEVGSRPSRFNVLRNIATMVIEAEPEFLRSLIAQPEVAAASPNQTKESAFIPPRGKRPVK
jgi:hypothetical protein